MTAFTTLPSAPADAAPPLPDPLSAPLRPRFYDGQYLSAESLALAHDYLRERLRRRNLFLHGSGVVCGLKVTCGPLPGFVTVASGYAIDGCGEDVFVPQPTPFDVLGNLPPSSDDPCLRPRVVLESGLPQSTEDGATVTRMTVVEAETVVVDQTRPLGSGGQELPISDAAAATLTDGEMVRLRDPADATRTQYVQVASAGMRHFDPPLAIDFDVAHVEVRRVTMTPADAEERKLVGPLDAGADRLTLSDAAGLAAGDVLEISWRGTQWVTVADQRSDVLLYLRYVEESAALGPAVPAGSCTGNGHCEVSRIRETFAVRIVRGEKPAPAPDLVDDIGACVTSLLDESGVVTISRHIAQTVEAADDWTDPGLYTGLSADFVQLRDALRKIAGAGVDCRGGEELASLEFPDPPVEGSERRFVEQLLERLATLYVHAFELAWDCACQALLVPCRACACPDQADVLLARVTVDSRGVVEICNHERRHVKTFPAVERWLSPFSRALVAPVNALLRKSEPHHRELRGPSDLVELICCELDVRPSIRSLVQWLLPQIHKKPTVVRDAFKSARQARKTAGVQAIAALRLADSGVKKFRSGVPEAVKRVRSVAIVEDADPVQATRVIERDTGLKVVGARKLDARELYTFDTIKATASALVTKQPVEIVYTPEGVAFLRTAGARRVG